MLMLGAIAMPEISASDWDAFLQNYPDAHILQTSAWGELKASFDWDTVFVVKEDKTFSDRSLGALILFRHLMLGLTLAYIPKGPVGIGESEESSSVWEEFWAEVDVLCRRQKAIFLKVEPDIWATPDSLNSSLKLERVSCLPGFRISQQDIQPVRTLLVDLNGSEKDVLARMKQKTRYNVRLALKKGVEVYSSSELDVFYRLMLTTGERDAFAVHSEEYYRKAYELFQPRGECVLLMAAYQREPIAAIMVFTHGSRAWYFYGASSDEHRKRMSTYLLQWEGMRWARAQGCRIYDLWGVPNADEAILETHFPHRSEGLWGVYRFKRGFGGQLRRSIGSWDRVYQPLLYTFYRWWTRNRAGE
jgi:lipid II:glycine glycyltransferase (peptidoglycan interpeptide bridge formation enzyme)